MVLEWTHDLERFFPGKYRAVALVGSDAEKRAMLDGKADIYVTNFESALRLGNRLGDVLGASGLLIVDESFFVKNRDAQRTAAVKRVRSRAGRCIVLCGTPAPNSAIDLVEQFNIADLGAAFAGVELPDDPREARNVVASIVERRGVYMRRLKTHVLDLPDRTFNRIHVELEAQQQALYDAARDSLAGEVAGLSEEEFNGRRASFAARRMALLQICSNPSAVDPTYDRIPAKLQALDALLPELIDERGEKVLVWSFFTRSLDAIARRYARYSPVRVDGTVKSAADRREAVRRFQEEPGCMLFIGNPAAAGAGLTLHRARHAIYESMSNQAAHYLQSLDRIHRRGQSRDVQYHVLLAAGTIEAAEYERLLHKEAAAQDLLGDEVSAPMTREGFLADLFDQHWGRS
jgi:SNF2 family DNA or RNA helicase